jgi:regulator of sigma E protease
MSIIIALLVFSFIVFIHELGHFYFARRGGITVEEFAIGMGPKLFGFHSKGCEWTVRLLPIGGFCRMLGEDGQADDEKKAISEEELDESVHQITGKSETTSDETSVEPLTNVQGEGSDNNGKPVKRQLQGTAFYEQSVWTRISAVIGGPLFNFILALVFSFILMALSTISTTEVAFVAEDSPAEAAGILKGDVMVSIDGHRLVRPREASIYINVPAGDPVDVAVERMGADGTIDTLTYEIKPAVIEMDPTLPADESENYYQIGVGYTTVETNFINVLKYGVLECLSWIKIVFYSLGLLVTGQVSGTALAGPVALVSEISSGYERSLTEGLKVVVANLSFWIVLISANLGIMNLLPIPALDGGRLVFLSLEAISGKPIAPEKEGFIHFIGFVLLMALMVFVMYNDILRLFGWG